jgi:hypothetical protein
MKVKKGMASSVSFDIVPQIRSGMCEEQRPGQRDFTAGKGASSTPMEEEQAVCRQRKRPDSPAAGKTISAGEHDRRHVLGDEFQHEHRAEQIPLQFQPGVRTLVEHFADDCIDRADDDCRQDQPFHMTSDERRDRIDTAAGRKQCLHPPVLPVVTDSGGFLSSPGNLPKALMRRNHSRSGAKADFSLA